MTTFEEIFAEEISLLDRAIANLPSEQNHIQRCLDLADRVEWDKSNAENAFGEMLGPNGVPLFDKITQRVAAQLRNEQSPELGDARKFLYYAMLVHDLGKYDSRVEGYNGSGHEARSAQIVSEKRSALQQQLDWTKENTDFLFYLTQFHGHLGITRLGEVSIVFLAPILDALLSKNAERKRLFLDFLIILTCCDAGASGDFETETYYLDESRISLYDQLAQELLELSGDLNLTRSEDARAALLEQASKITSTAVRIKRMVTSDNKLTVGDAEIKAALRNVVAGKQLDLKRFASMQFDHGAYVFAPLLTQLNRESRDVSEESLESFLIFLGRICARWPKGSVIQFRESFSMKEDLQARNGERFARLSDAVEKRDTQGIDNLISRYTTMKNGGSHGRKP